MSPSDSYTLTDGSLHGSRASEPINREKLDNLVNTNSSKEISGVYIVSLDWLTGNKATFGMALGLVLLPTLPFVLGQLFLLAGGRISFAPAAVILSISVVTALAVAWRVSGSWIVAVAIILVLSMTILASAMVIDTSYDGQQYHFDAVTALAMGWNPFRDTGPSSVDAALIDHLTPWVSHYPQGAWIVSALLYAIGLPIEATKPQSILLFMSLLFASFGIARALNLKRPSAVLVALVTAGNPVLIVQLFSRMNDGLLGACLALLAIFAVLAILRPSLWAWIGTACPILLVLNLKFSAIPLSVAICGMLVIFAWWMRGSSAALRSSGMFIILGLVGIFIIGAHPYVTNILEYGHPFYPVMGNGRIDIMEGNRPITFQTLSAAERILASYFGATASGYYPPAEHLKLPFRIYGTELRIAGEYGARIGGFGPLFSGALAFAAALAAIVYLHDWRPRTVTALLAAAAGTALLGLLMPEAWWARYVPQIWWSVGLVGLAALVSRPRWLQIGGGLLLTVLIANVALVAASSVLYIGERNLDIRRQITSFSTSSDKICVYVGEMHARVALLSSIKEKVTYKKSPLKDCHSMPLAADFQSNGASYCRCP